MLKKILFLFLLINPLLLLAQKKSVIQVISYDKISGKPKEDVLYLSNPVFRQDNATLTCDSAVFYSKRNYFEAYKNVHIEQLTTNIYSDQLHYDGNKKQAHLTSNVRMEDPQSILTTNILDYDMANKIGTYTSGGKIVNKEVTLTSKNGYYFSNSNDAYFRYNVVVVTPQTTIKSDTMRYNTQSKWTYFYGPTNIKGKDDNLYTENGAYNTQSEDAYFGKKNLYTQDTKSLKGDSLYYYGKKGYGKAVKNIVFTDKKDGTKLFGDLGYYYKIDQRTLVTRNAYLAVISNDSIMVNGKKHPDSLFMGADTLETQMVLQKTLKLIPKISVKADNEIGEDEDPAAKKEAKFKPEIDPSENRPDQKEDKSKSASSDKKRRKEKVTDPKSKPVADALVLKDSLNQKNALQLKLHTDSLAQQLAKMKTDSLQKLTLAKASAGIKNSRADSLLKAGQKITKENASKLPQLSKSAVLKDTTVLNPADTIQTRIIKGYHGVKIFKSNIQAKTDSLFYTSADSTLRCFSNPIIWSQGSQQIGDTIYVQFKNKKLNNMQAFRNAFLVNTNEDSLHFNQIKGRYMTSFFKEGKLQTLYVDGNAESIYYTRDDSTKVYKEMNQTLSSRIKFIFKNNDIDDIIYINGIEGAVNPENKVPKDNVLKGFSWKPTERPKSKKDAIGAAGGKPRPKTKPKPASAVKPAVVKTNPKAVTPVKPALKDSLKAQTDTLNFGIKPIIPKKDSTQVKKPLIKI